MNRYTKYLLFVGILLILIMLAGILAFIFSDFLPFGTPGLSAVHRAENLVLTGALFVLILAVAIAVAMLSIFLVSKLINESLSPGYTEIKIGEGLLFMLAAAALTAFLTINRAAVETAAPGAIYFQRLGEFLFLARDWGVHLILKLLVLF